MMSKRINRGKNKKNRSLSLTLSISFLSLISASLLLSGAIGTFFSFRTQQNIVFSQQQLIAQNAANKVTGFIQEKFSALETTARLVNPAVTSQKEQDRMLNHLLGPHPAFRQLVLLNSKKQMSTELSRLSRVGSNKINDRYENDLFSQAVQGKKYISSVYVDKVTSEPMVIMAVPVKDVFGDFRGVLIAEVNLKFMWDLVESLKIGKTGLAYVVNRQGNLVAFGDIARVLRGENAGNLKVVHEFINNVAPVDEAKAKVFTGINGATVLGTYVSLGMPDWAVVTELPVTEAYEQVMQTISIMAIFTLIMAATAGWAGVYLARRLAVPIVHLMETATRIAGGEMGLRADIGGTTEISGLAAAFNSMTDQLREVIGSLELRSRHLQSMVQQYVEYMAEVGDGKLDSRLVLKEPEGRTSDPLFVLGRQLNKTTENLQQLVEQIQEATDILKKREADLKEEITERKQAEERLSESLSLKRATLESTADGMLVVNSRGNVVDYNGKFRELWNIPPELMEQKDDDRIIQYVLSQVKNPETFANKIRELYNNPDADSFDEITFKDGRIVERYSIPHRLEGKGVGRVWSFRDVTERRQAEERLKKYSEELKQSNEDVLSFAYIVSHDLRAPLVSIKGFVGELQFALKDIGSILDRCMPHLDEKERTQLTEAIRKNVPVALNFIGSSVSRMDGLINAVLTLSRLGHRELKPEPVDVKEVVNKILSSLEHQIGQRKTVVTLGELPMITADKFAMEQIMGNLLDNALKYLEQDGEGKIAITAEQRVHEMTFHISDNGCGIAPEDLHKVFEIFRRVGKQDVPGEGMGLAYVKALVRKQGGRIWCESEPGKGTIFSFTVLNQSPLM